MRAWQTDAPRWIARVHASLPPEATVEDLRKALRSEASAFHCGTSWGQKVWSKHCRAYMAKLAGNGHYRSDGRDTVWPTDIHFPFREDKA